MNVREREVELRELLCAKSDRRVLWQLLLTNELSSLLRFAARLPPHVMSKVVAKALASCAHVTLEQLRRFIETVAIGTDATAILTYRLKQVSNKTSSAEFALSSIAGESERNKLAYSMSIEPQQVHPMASDKASQALDSSSVVISFHSDDSAAASKKDELKRYLQQMWRAPDEQYRRFDILEAPELGRCFEYMWAAPEDAFCETVATILAEKNIPLRHVESFLSDSSGKSFAQHRYEHFTKFGTILPACENGIDGSAVKTRFVEEMKKEEAIILERAEVEAKAAAVDQRERVAKDKGVSAESRQEEIDKVVAATKAEIISAAAAAAAAKKKSVEELQRTLAESLRITLATKSLADLRGFIKDHGLLRVRTDVGGGRRLTLLMTLSTCTEPRWWETRSCANKMGTDIPAQFPKQF